VDFLPFFSADPLKLCQVGWGALLHSYFQVSPEMLDRVQVRALAGPLKDIQRLVPSYSCIVIAVCLGSLSCWKVNPLPSQRSRVLWSMFLSRISLCFALFIFASILTNLPVPGQFLWPHVLVFALMCTVNCGTLYRHVCAFPNHVLPIEFTTGGLK
jgi:hypothetical protein